MPDIKLPLCIDLNFLEKYKGKSFCSRGMQQPKRKTFQNVFVLILNNKFICFWMCGKIKPTIAYVTHMQSYKFLNRAPPKITYHLKQPHFYDCCTSQQ